MTRAAMTATAVAFLLASCAPGVHKPVGQLERHAERFPHEATTSETTSRPEPTLLVPEPVEPVKQYDPDQHCHDCPRPEAE